MTIDLAQHTYSIAHLHRVAVVWLRTNIDTNVFDTTANPPDKILQDKIFLMLVLFWRKYANEVLQDDLFRIQSDLENISKQ